MRYPIANLGQSLLKHFDVPTGAFPVPWGPEKDEEERQQLYGRQMGIIPAMAFGTVFEYKEDDPIQYYDVRIPGQVRMGQGTGVVCEDTPEGGKRCSDGTYHPPGCPASPGAPGTVEAGAPGGLPVVPLLIAAGAAAGAILFLAGRKRRMGAEGATALETSYPETADKLKTIAGEITRERSNDAYSFAQFTKASRDRQAANSLLIDATRKLAEQERIWNATHRNQADYEASQREVDQLNAQKDEAIRQAEEAKASLDLAAANIMTYRQNAEALIATLPAEVQDDARRLIDPCWKGGPAMKGPSRFEGVTPEEYRKRSMGRAIPVRPIGLFRF